MIIYGSSQILYFVPAWDGGLFAVDPEDYGIGGELRMTGKYESSLGAYLEERDFHIVVVDTERSEHFALQGMQKILSNCKVLVVEFLPHHLKNVSGVTVEEFLSVIEPHFSIMIISSRRIKIGDAEFVRCLTVMCNLGQGDEGIIFEKT